MQPTRKAFQDVGTREFVKLTHEQKGDVITVLESMAADVAGGDDDLPADLFELRNRAAHRRGDTERLGKDGPRRLFVGRERHRTALCAPVGPAK